MSRCQRCGGAIVVSIFRHTPYCSGNCRKLAEGEPVIEGWVAK